MSTNVFTRDDLREMVKLIGTELKREDGLIREATINNVAYEQCRGQGITYLKIEHYYQFAAVRALLPTFRFRVKPEFKRFDLALFTRSSSEPIALGEIKLWMSTTGEPEIPRILKDREKLSAAHCATFLLIFSANPQGKAAENLRSLIDRLRCFSETTQYQFDTSFIHGGGQLREGEFSVLAGLLSNEK